MSVATRIIDLASSCIQQGNIQQVNNQQWNELYDDNDSSESESSYNSEYSAHSC